LSRAGYCLQPSVASSIVLRVFDDTGLLWRIALSAAANSANGSVSWSRSIVQRQTARWPSAVATQASTNALTVCAG
jgi:hypothetical protein